MEGRRGGGVHHAWVPAGSADCQARDGHRPAACQLDGRLHHPAFIPAQKWASAAKDRASNAPPADASAGNVLATRKRQKKLWLARAQSGYAVERQIEPDMTGARPKRSMADEPVKIKKYANRRLYNTGTSTYVTLEDL